MQKILPEMSVHTYSLVSQIDHFPVDFSVNWLLNGNKAGGDLVLIKTSLLLLCKSSYSCLLAGIKQEK